MNPAVEDLWDFEDPVASEGRFRAAIDAGQGDVPALQTQLARTLGLQQRYDEAHALLDGLADSLGEVAVRASLERGRLLRSAGDPGAEDHFRTAVALAAAEHPALKVDALHMLALLPVDPLEQVVRGEQALVAARAATDPGARKWEASVLNNLGCALVDAGRLDDALRTFEDALVVRRAQGSAREVQIARWMVAWTLRLLGRTGEARLIQQAIKAELVAAGAEDPFVDEELALLG